MKHEQMIDKILIYMREKIIKTGGHPRTSNFNFSFDEDDKDEDSINLQKILKINDETFKNLLTECVTDGYLKHLSASENFNYLIITDKGMARAKSAQITSPYKQCMNSLLAHPLFNTIISVILSFIIGFYLGRK